MKRLDGRPRQVTKLSGASRAARKKDYTRAELEKLTTLSTGQADDLKVDTGEIRVWLSRCTVDDGEPYNNKVTVEFYNKRLEKWVETRHYEAK